MAWPTSSAPPFSAVPEPVEPERAALAFARVLRGMGLDVPVGNVIAFAEALGLVGMGRRPAVYWAGRATLVRRPEDAPAYDRAFDAFWHGRVPMRLGAPQPVEVTVVLDTGEDDAGAGGEEQAEESGPTLVVRWSPQEMLRHKDFAAYTHSEFEEARRLMADLRLAGALRRSRRLRRSAKQEGRPDLR